MNRAEWIKWHWESGCPVYSCAHQTIHETCRISIDRKCKRKSLVITRMIKEAVIEEFKDMKVTTV